MPYSYIHYVGDGSTKTFSVPFPFLKKTYVKAYVNYVERTFTWATANTITLDGDAPGVDVDVWLARVTPINQKLITFNNTTILDASYLNQSNDYNLHIVQEASERQDRALIYNDQDLKYDADGKLITNLGVPVDPSDVTNKAYVDGEVTAAKAHVDAELAANQVSVNAALAEMDSEVTTAQGYATTALGASTDASDAATLAEKWASEAEGIVVQSGEYSAYHWAQKAYETATAEPAIQYHIYDTTGDIASDDVGIINMTNTSDVTMTLPPASEARGKVYAIAQTGTGNTVLQGLSYGSEAGVTEVATYLDDLIVGTDVYTRVLTSGTYFRVTYNAWKDGQPLVLGGTTYTHGVGMNGVDYDGTSTLPAPAITLNRNLAGFIKLRGTIGWDDNKRDIAGSIPKFRVSLNNTTDLITNQEYSTPTVIDVDLSTWGDMDALVLEVNRDATDSVWGVWGDLRLVRSISEETTTVYETIDGENSVTLAEGESISLFSDGTNWFRTGSGGSGGGGVNYNSFYADHTLLPAEQGIVNIDSNANLAFNLPLAKDNSGVWYYLTQTGNGTVTVSGQTSSGSTTMYLDDVVAGTDVTTSANNSVYPTTFFNAWGDSTPFKLDGQVVTHAMGHKTYEDNSSTEVGSWKYTRNLKGFTRLQGTLGVDSTKGGTSPFTFKIKVWTGSTLVELYTVTNPLGTTFTTRDLDLDLTQWANTAGSYLLIETTPGNKYAYSYVVFANMTLTYTAVSELDWINSAHTYSLTKTNPSLVYSDGIKWQAISSLNETSHDSLDHTGLTGIPSITGLLNETSHDLLNHSGLTGIPDTTGLLNETSHDLLDHTGLTGCGGGGLDEAAHDALDHSGLTGIPSITGLLDETSHDALDHSGLTGVGITSSDHSSIDHTGLPGIQQTAVGLSSYTHTQGSSSATWTVAHNLNDYPLVNVLDASNNQMDYDVTYTDLNNLTISLASATTGSVKCYTAAPMISATTENYYVDAAVSSSGDGLSWGTAFKTLAALKTQLDKKSLYSKQVQVYIKTGTYNDPLVVTDKMFVGGLHFNTDSGDVTITGTTTLATNVTASINFTNICGNYVYLGKSGSYKFVCAPSSVGSSDHRALYYQNCFCLNMQGYVTIDGSTWSTTTKYGAFANGATNCRIYGSISSTTYAAYASFGSSAYVELSGSSNTTVLTALTGSTIRKSSTYTITGTTAITKSNGSQVINADGTLA